MHHMDWDDYRFFLAVSRSGSVRGAAARLGVNHSTVSRRIDAAERKLGVRLFERLPGGYFATAAGEEMRAAAERIEAEALGIERQVAGRDARLSGPLRVTLPDSLAQCLLMPDLVAFADAHPEIEMELDVTYSLADLAKREADVAIRMSNDPPEHLVGRRILKYATAIYAATTYLERHDLLRAPEALTWIGWDDAVPDPQWIRESGYPRARIQNRVPNSVVQIEAAKAGMGLSMLPCFMGDAEPGLRRLPPGGAAPSRDIWLLTHEDLRQTARVRKFLDCMAEAIRCHRDLLEGRCPRA